MKNGLEDYYVIRGNKKMRFGYTTGSCAAAACKGATEILLGGKLQETVTLMTPKGILLTLELKDIQIETDKVTCAILSTEMSDGHHYTGVCPLNLRKVISTENGKSVLQKEFIQK